MRRSQPLSGLFRLSATPLATLLLWTVAIPSLPASAIYRNNFQLCASELLRAGISAAGASDACSAALYPKDLTICVTSIDRQTNIAAADALATCRQVRRPRDLAACVVNISKNTQSVAALDVLDNCRRSLLPVRFADCVVGLNREVDFSVAQVMATCIDGSDRPQDFYPLGADPRRGVSVDRPIPVPLAPLPVAPIR